MWPKSYKDYPADMPLIKEQVSPNHGIIGCEMHDLNGWGGQWHRERKRRKKGILTALKTFISSFKNKNKIIN